MDIFNKDFSTLSLLQKLLFFLLLPIGILFLLWKLKDLLSSSKEDSARKSADDKSKDLDSKIESTKIEESKIEGSIETLEKEKKDALDKANSQDAVDFYNSRKSDK